MCVILYTEIDGKQILAKNRDRTYKPEIEIIHEIVNGIELAYIRDLKTGWIEGMNELGTAMVNSTLNMNESKHVKKLKKIILKTKKNKIYNALTESSKQNVFYDLTRKPRDTNYVLEGNTLLAFNNEIFHIENDVFNNFVIKKINKPVVYTNHGINLKDEGFTEGKKGLSSFLRKKLVETELKQHKDVEIQDFTNEIMNNNYENIDPRFHSYRDKKTTLKRNKRLDEEQIFISTIGQLLLNITDKELYYYHDKNNSGKIEYVNKLPRDYTPKIRVIIKTIEKNQKPTKILTRRYINKMCRKFDYYDKETKSCPFYKNRKTKKNRKLSSKNKTYRNKEDDSK